MIEKPPFTITADILSLVERIGEAIGRAAGGGFFWLGLFFRQRGSCRQIQG